MSISAEDIERIARRAAEEVVSRLRGNPSTGPDNNGSNPPVRLVGVGPPVPRPGRGGPIEERPRRPAPAPSRRYEFVPPEEEARILQLREQGLTFRQIAERMNRSLSVVWRTINREHPPLRRAVTPQRQQDAMLLRRMGLTLEEIGSRLRLTPTMARYILHRGGERVDLVEAAQRLNRRMWAVSGSLDAPATHDRLGDGARRLRNIADDAALIVEITPEEVPEPLRDYPYEIGWLHSRALLAEEVLRTGLWCLLREPREPLPEPRERLRACAEAARDSARGVIEGWEGYEVKAGQVVRQIEGIMAVATAEVPEEAAG
jgi:orotate phosphoribosyltransferase-like protein